MNTVSRTKTLLITSMMPLFAAPMLSHAESASQADAPFDACVKAFVAAKFEKERHYTVVSGSTRDFDPQESSYRITLAATGKQSGKKLASATCIVDRAGVTLTVNGKSYAVPTSGENAVLSAR